MWVKTQETVLRKGLTAVPTFCGKHVVVKILSQIELFNILNGIVTWNGSIHNFKFPTRMSLKSKRPFELTMLKGLWPQSKDILHSFRLKTLNFYGKTQITIHFTHLDKTPLLMIFAYTFIRNIQHFASLLSNMSTALGEKSKASDANRWSPVAGSSI